MEVTPEKAGTADVGIVGIGVMGSNLALNMLDRGFKVAVWNLETEVAERFLAMHVPKYGADRVLAGATYEDFAQLLCKPRKALILVTAGKATDAVIENLTRVFEDGDVIVDTGNAHFKERHRRGAEAALRRLCTAAGWLQAEGHDLRAALALQAAAEGALTALAGDAEDQQQPENLELLLAAVWPTASQCLALAGGAGVAAAGTAAAVREGLIAVAELLPLAGEGLESSGVGGASALSEELLQEVACGLDLLLVELYVGLCRVRDALARSSEAQAVVQKMLKDQRTLEGVALWMATIFVRIVGPQQLSGQLLWEWVGHDAPSVFALTMGVLSLDAPSEVQFSSEVNCLLPADLPTIQHAICRALFELTLPDVAFFSLPPPCSDDEDREWTIAELNRALALHREALATALAACGMVPLVVAWLRRLPEAAAAFLAALLRQPAGAPAPGGAPAALLEESQALAEQLRQSSGELWPALAAGCPASAGPTSSIFFEDCATLAFVAPPAADVAVYIIQRLIPRAGPSSLAAMVALAANASVPPGVGSLSAALEGAPSETVCQVRRRLGSLGAPLRADGLAPWIPLLHAPARDAAAGDPAGDPAGDSAGEAGEASEASAEAVGRPGEAGGAVLRMLPPARAPGASAGSLRGLLGGVPAEVACALDGRLLLDPVRTPYGHVFERPVLERALAEAEGRCPLTGRPLELAQCTRAPEVRQHALHGPPTPATTTPRMRPRRASASRATRQT
ncbi:unnamed protein product [Prorocentrum cordatum]|uniref:Phosphogluconate dehydrogenase (NADP(+)-dependent, decarboxylating) n=1 Tax=Prorocentrum cordatum TaxID=2364126 RepID=A0ABN9U9B9_9DINO|nr:unnamed protein product [Polarella glacialis]